MTQLLEAPKRTGLIAALFHCPECERPTIMNIDSIQPGHTQWHDVIVYKCAKCGAKKNGNDEVGPPQLAALLFRAFNLEIRVIGQPEISAGGFHPHRMAVRI
jgi:hypothetical protein